jgi:hypothetical protein
MIHLHEKKIQRKRPRRRTGAASIEAVMLLPFFILIFACVLYLEDLWENKQIAMLGARRSAWNASLEGCPKKPGSENTNEFSGEMGENGRLDKLSGIPIVGNVIEGFFGKPSRSGASREVERPPLLGGGTVEIPGCYYLMCNEKDRKLGEVVTDTFRDASNDIVNVFD